MDTKYPRFITLHCVHNDGPVTVDLLNVGAIRLIENAKVTYTKLHMRGMADIEIREPYEVVIEKWLEYAGILKER